MQTLQSNLIGDKTLFRLQSLLSEIYFESLMTTSVRKKEYFFHEVYFVTLLHFAYEWHTKREIIHNRSTLSLHWGIIQNYESGLYMKVN